MARNNFSYFQFVKNNLDNVNEPIKPSTLVRGAMNAGATGSSSSIQKKIRSACEMLANSAGYKRVKTPDVSGYQYIKEA